MIFSCYQNVLFFKKIYFVIVRLDSRIKYGTGSNPVILSLSKDLDSPIKSWNDGYFGYIT
jgi:hypothetical protein